jgi:hypothetical protein
MNKTIKQLIIISIVYCFLSPSLVVAVDRPNYALDPDNLPTALSDYTLKDGSEAYALTAEEETYSVTYVGPPECWPVNDTSPACTISLAFSYTKSLNATEVELQDQAAFDELNLALSIFLLLLDYEDVTDEVPGAAFAYIYNSSGLIGTVYVGLQVGIMFEVSDGTLPVNTLRGVGDNNVQLRAATKTEVIDAMIAAYAAANASLTPDLGGEDDSDFGSIVIITSSLMVSTLVIRRRRN